MSSAPVGTGIRNGSVSTTAITNQPGRRTNATVSDHQQHQPDDARRAQRARRGRETSSLIEEPEISATAPSARISATGIASARERGSRSTSTAAAASAAASAAVPSTKLAAASDHRRQASRSGSAGCEPMM